MSSEPLILRRLSTNFDVFACDVTSLLPSTWDSDLRSLINQHGFQSRLDGSSLTSRENVLQPKRSSELTVVDGPTIARATPWLFELYRGPFLELANSTDLGGFSPSSDVRSAVNVNCQHHGQRYEWHVDSNPLTGVLFATTADPGQGGDLVFIPDPLTRPASSWEVRVSPVAGTLLLFDARYIAHHVEAVTATQPRVSVPMNYYLLDRGIARPDDLDAYLYKTPS